MTIEERLCSLKACIDECSSVEENSCDAYLTMAMNSYGTSTSKVRRDVSANEQIYVLTYRVSFVVDSEWKSNDVDCHRVSNDRQNAVF
jgi:hypothetical protein